jgi:hypothetical protein
MILCLITKLWHGEENMNKKIWIAVVALFVISAASLIAVMAYKGDPNVKGPNYNVDTETKLEAAMDAGDYDAWVQIRKDNNLPMQGRMFQVINKDNFGKYVEMHEAMLSGDTAKADAIRAELGLGQGMRNGQGSIAGCGMNAENTQSGCQHAQNSGSCPMAETGTCPMNK